MSRFQLVSANTTKLFEEPACSPFPSSISCLRRRILPWLRPAHGDRGRSRELPAWPVRRFRGCLLLLGRGRSNRWKLKGEADPAVHAAPSGRLLL